MYYSCTKNGKALVILTHFLGRLWRQFPWQPKSYPWHGEWLPRLLHHLQWLECSATSGFLYLTFEEMDYIASLLSGLLESSTINEIFSKYWLLTEIYHTWFYLRSVLVEMKEVNSLILDSSVYKFYGISLEILASSWWCHWLPINLLSY